MALVDRVKNILLAPKAEWEVIDAEPATVASLFTGYAIPLSLIPAICSAIGFSLIGIMGFKVPLVTGLTHGIVGWVFGLVSIYILALIVDALAPTFGGTKNPVQALKVVVYSYTAAWVGGIFMLLPALSVISLIFSLYSLYLLFLGLPVLMKTPTDKALGYAAVVIIVAIIVNIVILSIVTALGFGMGAGAMGSSSLYRP